MSLTPDQEELRNRLLDYNGARYDPDTNPPGFAGEGYKITLPGAMNDAGSALNEMGGILDETIIARDQAVAAAVSAPKSSSSTSATIASSGSVTLTVSDDIPTEVPFLQETYVKVYYANDPTKFFEGRITDIDADDETITILRSYSEGSGTYGNWQIVSTGPRGPQGSLSFSSLTSLSPEDADLLVVNDTSASGAPAKLSLSALFAYVLAKLTATAQNLFLGAYSESIQNLGAVSGTVTLSLADNGIHKLLQLEGNVTYEFPSGLATGRRHFLTLKPSQAASGTKWDHTFPANVHSSSSMPSLTQTYGAHDHLAFSSDDGGTTWDLRGFTQGHS